MLFKLFGSKKKETPAENKAPATPEAPKPEATIIKEEAKAPMSEKKYVAAIDQGTTSTRCMLFTKDGRPAGSYQMEHEQIFPHPG